MHDDICRTYILSWVYIFLLCKLREICNHELRELFVCLLVNWNWASVTLEKGTVRADPKLVEPREIFLLMSQALWTRLLLSYLWHLGFILHYRLNLLLIKTPVTLSERQCDISMPFYQFKQDSMKKLTFSQSNYECQNCRNPSFNYCHLESEKC